MEKESNGFLKEPKQVLVFNAAQVLIAITRSVRSAYELTGGKFTGYLLRMYRQVYFHGWFLL